MTPRALLAAAGLSAVLAATAAGSAGASPLAGETGGQGSGRHTASARTAAPPTTATSATQVVTLPTGDRITIGHTSTGAPTLAVPAGLRAQAVRLGANQYVFPRSIGPVLGSVLDPELFNLTRIATDAGRVPVTVTYADPASPTAVPGVEVTARTGLTGRGYVTNASSRALGAALAKTGATTLFSGVTGVRGLATSTPARYPMHTLTLCALGRDGKPRPKTMITYLNTVDPRRGFGFAYAHRGCAKASVAEGTYEISADVPNDDWSEFYFANSGEFRVSGPRTATVDMRTATTLFETGLSGAPATPVDEVTEVTRDFPSFSSASAVIGTVRTLFSPTVGTSHGQTTISRVALAQAPAGPADGRYALYFRHPGRIPDAPIRATQRVRDLARITSVFATPPTDSPLFTRAVFPATGGWSIGTVIPTPGTIHEFVTSGPGLITNARFTLALHPTTFDEIGTIESESRDVPARQVRTEEWNKGPVHATSFDDPTLWNGQPIRCDWCVKGSQLALVTLSGGDTDRHHVPYPMPLPDGSPNVTWSVSADGTTVATGTAFLGVDGAVSLPARTAVVTARQTMVRPAPYTSGTRSVTTWRMPMAATRPLPAGYVCELGDGCRILPFLSTAYDLPVDIGGALLGGRQTLGITVHQAGRISPRGITGVTVSANYGAGWVPATVTALGGGRYAAALQVPWRAGARVAADLSITVTAADGSRMTDRITDAFLLKSPIP